jgi:Flp pilus assembly protein TadD
VGVAYYLLGRYEDSVVMYRESVALAPDDAVTWMNLGDSLRQTGRDDSAAREAYQRALTQLDAMLEVNPRDTELLSSAAHCQARLGNDAGAMALVQRAIEGAPTEPYNFYFASLVHLEAGRTIDALAAIRQAVELNFPVDQLRSDPQFRAIADDPDFQALLVAP